MMPLTSKGREILAGMEKTYGPEKAKQVLYASKNKGTITGIDSADWMDAFSDEDVNYACDTLARGDEGRVLYKGWIIDKEGPRSFRVWMRAAMYYRGADLGRFPSLEDAKAAVDKQSATDSKLDALCDAARNLDNRVDMRLDDHRVLGGVGFTPPSGGVRGDAAVGDFVKIPGKPLPSGKTTSPLRARITRMLPDGLIEVKVVTPGMYEGGYEKIRPSDLQ